MTTFSSAGIASWPAGRPVSPGRYRAVSIATTTSDQPAPQWRSCINALIDTGRKAKRDQNRDPEEPSLETIQAAMHWLYRLRDEYPQAPPTLVSPEPAGGLIIERRAQGKNDLEIISELTLYNNRRAEMTHYANGKVIRMVEVRFSPDEDS